MKLTTILVTIALCFSAFSAEYASIDQAYAARDYSYIVNNASTNSNSNIKIAAKFMKAQKWNDAEKTALADAYSNAGWQDIAYRIIKYSCSTINKDKELEYINKLIPNFTLPNGEVYIPTDTLLLKNKNYINAATVKFIQYIQQNPEKAANFQNFTSLVNLVARRNKLLPDDEKVQLNITDSMMLAFAKKEYIAKSNAIIVGNRENSIHLQQIYFNNANFKSEITLYNYALNMDRYSKTTWAKEHVFDRLTSCKYRSLIAIRLNDPDKLLLALEGIDQNTFTAEDINKILILLNGQKSDWRPNDVKKALLNINSMYTTKLYNDRDTWEPVLSKLRAMIEIR